jgi:nucleoid DNA-binding protein
LTRDDCPPHHCHWQILCEVLTLTQDASDGGCLDGTTQKTSGRPDICPQVETIRESDKEQHAQPPDLDTNDCQRPGHSISRQSRTLSSRIGREMLVAKVRDALGLGTTEAAAGVTNTVISCLEDVLVENLETDGFAIKLNKFGKLTVRHRPASLRPIPFTGATKLRSSKRKVKFVTLGRLRQLEKAKPTGAGG